MLLITDCTLLVRSILYFFLLTNQEFCSDILYSRYGTGISLESRLMRGVLSNANDINIFSIIFPRTILPLQARSSPMPSIRIRAIVEFLTQFLTPSPSEPPLPHSKRKNRYAKGTCVDTSFALTDTGYHRYPTQK